MFVTCLLCKLPTYYLQLCSLQNIFAVQINYIETYIFEARVVILGQKTDGTTSLLCF